MKSQAMRHILLATSLFLLSFSAYAQQWYHVELVVFEQLSTVTDEQWPVMNELTETTLTPQSANAIMQPAQASSLSPVVSRLSRSANYRVHYHKAWQQVVQTKRGAKPIAVQSNNALIDGYIKLYKKTYLHAELDLWLQQNQQQVDSWSDASPEGVDISAPANPNLHESRRIRSKKLYFFDHPKIGALLELTPIETPTAVQASNEQLETFSLPTEAAPTTAE